MYYRLAKMKKERKKPKRISFSEQGEVLVSLVQRIKYGRILSTEEQWKILQKIIRNHLEKEEKEGAGQCLPYL